MNYNSISNFINEIEKDLDEVNEFLISLNSINSLKDLLENEIISLNPHFFSLLTLKRFLINNKKNILKKNKIDNIFTAIQPEEVLYLDIKLQQKIVSMVDKFIELDNYNDLKYLFTFLVLHNYDIEVMKLGKHFIKNKYKEMIESFLYFLIIKNDISNYLKVKKIYDKI